MPKAKLTLSVEEQLIREAKRLAAAQGTSLSAIISRLPHAVTVRSEDVPIGPLTRRAIGIAKVPDKPVQELLADALSTKHSEHANYARAQRGVRKSRR